MQNFTFVVKHISRNAKNIVDSLSKRCLILQEFQVKTLGFEHLKEMHCDDPDFKEAYEACANHVLKYGSQWKKYLIQDILLFKGCQLCIPKCSMREKLFKEKHSGGLVGHFRHDKTFSLLISSYHWPGMREKVKKFANKCKNLQYAKGKKQNTRLY
jgi:hypothetical protein